MSQFENQSKSYILDIEVRLAGKKQIPHEEWLQMLQDGRTVETPFIWVNKITFVNMETASKDWFNEGILQTELNRSVSELEKEEVFFKTIEPLYFHNGIRKFLPDITDEMREQIVKKATAQVDAILNQVEGESK
ncbi:Uncharacterised protein [Listeria fleischmannii subsp. fleischmannii]|uniref:Uncharacterized protein n=1 Tax=Listeria fleischmannii subsp. fleischmannii TaxID=1671902 RepID=A0A2X3H7T0_9LIST|nr:hypothetical protein [Listeria fleischmannii]SQC68547.1 Uncharacterised protein [Listeria fleischmannii subsp. fleischmannii]